MAEAFSRANVSQSRDGGFGLRITLRSGEEKEYPSLFVSRAEAERLCERINRLGVSECHIYDVIEDSLP